MLRLDQVRPSDYMGYGLSILVHKANLFTTTTITATTSATTTSINTIPATTAVTGSFGLFKAAGVVLSGAAYPTPRLASSRTPLCTGSSRAVMLVACSRAAGRLLVLVRSVGRLAISHTPREMNLENHLSFCQVSVA